MKTPDARVHAGRQTSESGTSPGYPRTSGESCSQCAALASATAGCTLLRPLAATWAVRGKYEIGGKWLEREFIVGGIAAPAEPCDRSRLVHGKAESST